MTCGITVAPIIPTENKTLSRPPTQGTTLCKRDHPQSGRERNVSTT